MLKEGEFMATLGKTYTLEDFAKLFTLTDEATISSLYTEFLDRDPKDNNFALYIKQTEQKYYPQYNKLVRDESVQYDAMVTDYMERQIKHNMTASKSAKGSNSGSGTITAETSEQGENGNTRTLNTENSVEGSGTNDNTETRNLQTSQETQGINKTNPMQMKYSTSSGIMPELDWDTADGQSQEKINGTDTGTVENNGRNSNKQKTADTGTITDSGTNTSTGKSTTKNDDTRNIENNETNEENSDDKERYTGRHGYSAPELLEKSRQFILLTTAFQWYVSKFEKCFVWSVEI